MVAAIAFVLPAAAESRLPQPIYFFTNTAQPINRQNPLVIRPKGFLLFQDGQWVLERLRWTGWGSSVARATGVSNSSNDIPNAAEGKRIKTWAHVTLSNPGRFRGHDVYRCFTLTVPPPASYPPLCLGHPHGASPGVYILEPAKHPATTPTTGPLHLRSFMSPDRKVWCGIGTEGASCGTYPEPPTRSGEVNAGGQVRICTVLQLEYPNGAHVPQGCYQNWPTPEEKTPVLSVGKQTEVDGFRCTSATNGITCVTVAGAGAGKGFRASSTEAVEVG